MGHDMLHVGDAPVARIKQLTTAGARTGFMTEHTLIFVLQGQKQLLIDDQSFTADAGNLFFIKRGIYVMSELMLPGASYEALIIFFTDDFFKRFLHTYKLISDQPVTAVSHLVIPSNHLLNEYSTQFLGYFGRDLNTIQNILPLKQQELLLLLLSGPYRNKILSFLQNITNGTPLDIEFIVKKHLFQPLSVEELAKLSGRSLASFKRDFQQQFQSPPKKWINDQRLAHARNLLQQPGKQVSEVALECGFENIPHFIRIFKQKYGHTPARSKKAIL
jgi:AraC-like DNA-binding protein